jgi:NNP family nitrate/nitrite transporter-like MFS transporter
LAFSFVLRPVLCVISVYYLNFLCRLVFAPLLPIIEGEFGLGHGEAGALFLFLTSGYGVGLLGSTFVSSRLNHRRTIFLSALAVGGSMLVLSRSPTISYIHGSLVLVGISSGLYFPSGIGILTEVVGRKHWGKAMALHEFAPATALITAPMIVELLLRWTAWRSIVGIIGLCSLPVAFLFLLFGARSVQKGAPPEPSAVKAVLWNGPFWVMTVVFIISIGASLGLYSILPLFLVSEMGWEREAANSLVGFSRIFGAVFLLFSGVITDRIGVKQAVVLFLTILGMLTLLLGLVRGPVMTPALIILQATSLPCFFGAAFAMASLIFSSHLRSLGMSFLVLIGVVGGAGFVPPSIGCLAEILSFSLGFTLLGLSALAVLPLVWYVKRGAPDDSSVSGQAS